MAVLVAIGAYLKYSFTYDPVGNPLTARVEGADEANIFTESESTYSTSRNYMKTVEASFEYDKDSRIANIFYNNPYKNHGNVESFSLKALKVLGENWSVFYVPSDCLREFCFSASNFYAEVMIFT